MAAQPWTTTVAGLASLDEWEDFASGVWRARFGQTGKELAYTSLAARAPRVDALNALPARPFPFADAPILAHQSEERLIQVRLPVDAEESIYGFGLQFDGLKKSQTVLQLNVDHWARGGGRTHAPVPFYLSSRGYGVLFNTARFLKVYVQVGNRKGSPNNPTPVDRVPPPQEPAPYPWTAQPESDAIEAYLSANGLELVVFAGESLQDVVARYNLYCGGGALPPLWGLGFWHRTPSDFTDQQAEAEVDAFAEHDVPLDVLGLEPGWMTRSYPSTFEWQKHRFPEPAAFAHRLADRGIHLNLWENPYVSPEGELYERLLPYSGSHLVWLGLVPDYTVPEAQEILCRQHAQDHLRIGVSGYKIDEVDGYDQWLWPEHATFPSGTSGETMRQAYGLMMQNMLYKRLFHANNTRTYSLVRASNAGASGLPFAIYSDSYNHAQYITGISAASLCGILWTPEVRQAATAEEWRARIQTVCFSPLAMLNAWASGKEPWDYASVADDVCEAIRLRMRLLPYLYTAFANYNRFGIPPLRAMVLEQGSPEVSVQTGSAELDDVTNPYATAIDLARDDQFMFGPSILVAPYYEEQTLERTVRLPRGNWYDLYTGQFVGNGTTIEVATPERIPLFVRDGAVIPLLTEHVNHTRQAYGHPLEVRHYGEQPGAFDLYEDDGVSYEYEAGAFALRRFTFAGGKGAESVPRPGPRLFGPVERWVDMTDTPEAEG